jgi:FkbM family methyltransferase
MAVKKGNVVLYIGLPNPTKLDNFLEIIGKNGKIIVVEPEPKNIQNLERYAKDKNYKNISIIKKAIWNQEMKTRLRINVKKGDHKIEINGVVHDNDLDTNRKYIDEIDVDTITLDTIFKQNGTIDFLFMAINGAELEALKGGRKFLSTTNCKLWIKGHALLHGKPINESILSFLKSFNYHAVVTAPSEGILKNWPTRAGDVFAWKK